MELIEQGHSGFAAATLVHAREGLKPIEGLRVGEWVLAYPDDVDPPLAYREAPEYLWRKVARIYVLDDQSVVNLTAWDLGNNIEETFQVTPNHPVFVKGGGWTQAGALRRGNALKEKDFADLWMKSIHAGDARARVFNIEVEEFHTYFVGEMGVWVHNTGAGGVLGSRYAG